VALAALLAGCHKDTSAPAPAPAVAPASPKDAAPQLVELLHGSAAKIVVSSQVANAAIKPEHLVDRDLNTAWNSRTGELVGAWMEITVPDGATIEELRMTAGHTGKGPKGEDYFTMNPRIRTVSVLAGDKALGTFPLDIAKRDLQTLHVHATGTVRVRIDRIEAGSKKTWRETCVSELEAWGTLPPGTKPIAQTPPVTVYQPPVAPKSFCERLDEMRAERETERKGDEAECMKLPNEEDRAHCGVDEPGDPDCDSEDIAGAHLAGPWVGATQDCMIQDNIYGPADCTIVVKTKTQAIAGPDEVFDMKSGRFQIAEVTARDVLPGGDPEVVVRYSGQDAVEHVVVCRTAPTAACSEPVAASTALGPATLVFK
jgi:hypothetical protein